MSKKDDLDMSPDAALAVEHTPEREAEQLEYFGGEKDEIDDYDPAGEDDGSVVNPAPATESPKDEDTEEEVSDESAVEAEESSDDDADEEDADEANADDDSEDEGEADSKPAAKGIPKHRFDEVNERRKAAEEELSRLKAERDAGKAPDEGEEPFDFDAAEREYLDLTLDGDTDGALAKRREIRAAEHASWKAEAKSETKEDLNAENLRADLQDMYTQAEDMFDELNPNSEGYRQDLVDRTLVYYKGYMAEGNMTPADAFVAGLADVVELAGLQEMGEEEADTGPKPTGSKKTGGKAKEEAKKKAHVPVAGEGTGANDAGVVAPDVATMTDEEFDALPAAKQARLRGDVL